MIDLPAAGAGGTGLPEFAGGVGVECGAGLAEEGAQGSRAGVDGDAALVGGYHGRVGGCFSGALFVGHAAAESCDFSELGFS